MKMSMITDLRKLAKIAFSPVHENQSVVSVLSGDLHRVSAPDALLGRGSLTVSDGRIMTRRDVRNMKTRVHAHDFRA